MIRQLTLALLLCLCASLSRAAELVPVFDTSLLLGQVFQNGAQTSWQGNAALQVTPAVRFNDSWGLIPTYAASYEGTKNVTDLGSGGQLFQDSMSHSLSVRGIYRYGELKLKPTAGYRWEFLRETTDESWGRGLFDYRKPSLGLESEYAFAPGVLASASMDAYAIQFPNYASLESEVQGSGLGREEAQARTLDSNNLSWTAGGECPLPIEGGHAKLSVNLTQRWYPQQHLVVDSGDLTADKRADEIVSAIGTLFYGRQLAPRAAALLSFQLGETRYRSNQNHYDPELNVFTPNYYSYDERTLMPKLTAILGRAKVEYSISYLLQQRDYLGRQAQDAAGTYIGQAVSMSQETFLFDLAIPITGGLRLIAHAALANSSSNMKFENTFKYNYTISNHLIGLSYSY